MPKKKATSKPPTAEPGYLDFLETPKVIPPTPPTPADFLAEPNVTVGKERIGDPIRRQAVSGPITAVRGVPDPPASASATSQDTPQQETPVKKTRKHQPRNATAREKAILSVPRPGAMTFQRYCLGVRLPLRESWGPRPNNEKTIADAYNWKNKRLLGLAKDERKNAWKLRDEGVI